MDVFTRPWHHARMRMIGLIGGMSWESSAAYYRILNEGVRDRLGPTASARCLLWSFDFSEIEALQHRGDWEGLAQRLVDAAQRLEAAGAEALLICTNTMHRLAGAVEGAVAIPLLHIADPTAERIKAAGIRTVGLLGTAFTMEQSFYKDRLADRHGLRVIVPDESDRRIVHRVIYEELVAGQVVPESREAYRAIIARLVAAGAEAVILGCTEIMLLVRPEDSAAPVFDTTAIHAAAAVEWALADAAAAPVPALP
jgi:aspartate racemase